MNLKEGFLLIAWAPGVEILGLHDDYQEARIARDNLLKELNFDWVSIIQVSHDTNLVESLTGRVYGDNSPDEPAVA